MAPDQIDRCCPLCEGNRADVLLAKNAVRLVRCARCKMIYANPVDSDLAGGTFYDRRGESFYLSPEKLESDYAPIRFSRELRIFRRFCPSGSVLDVGCSTGAFLYQLQKQFDGDYQVAGTDVTSAALEHAESRGIPVIRGSFLDMPLPDTAYDAVTFWAVIEHLVEPKKFLAKAYSVLKSGGHCFILVPNMQSLAVRLLGAKYRYIMPDHVNYFTPATLKALAETVRGFRFLAMKSTHFNPVVILKDFKGRTSRVPDQERAALLRRTTAWKQNPMLRPIQWVYSAVEGLLGSLSLADNLTMVLSRD